MYCTATFCGGHDAAFCQYSLTSYCLLLLDDELEEGIGIGAGSISSSGIPEKLELDSTLRILGTKLSDVRTCGDLVTKHGTALQRALGELSLIHI